MGTLHFKATEVAKLIKTSIDAEKRSLTFSQKFDPEYWLVSPEREQQIINEINSGKFPSIDLATEIDYSKIPVGLHLVGDQGVYLMSNKSETAEELQSAKANGELRVLYAMGGNPQDDYDTAYWLKVDTFGQDDGVDFLGGDALISLTKMVLSDDDYLEIEITPDVIEVLGVTTISRDMRY